MSTQSTQPVGRATLDEREVAAYLRAHPDFFVAQPGLLADMVIPHPSGSAVSLVERQLSLLREENVRLKQKFQTLVHNARYNEALGERMHELTLALLAVTGHGELLDILYRRLCNDFEADEATLCLTRPVTGLDDEAPQRGGPSVRIMAAKDLQQFDKVLLSTAPVCGRLTHRQMHYLFGERGAEVNSVALLPLRRAAGGEVHAQALGMLAIGRRTEQRFQSGMGTVFLTHLADTVSVMLFPHSGG